MMKKLFTTVIKIAAVRMILSHLWWEFLSPAVIQFNGNVGLQTDPPDCLHTPW
jgi:hypothetical protein